MQFPSLSSPLPPHSPFFPSPRLLFIDSVKTSWLSNFACCNGDPGKLCSNAGLKLKVEEILRTVRKKVP